MNSLSVFVKFLMGSKFEKLYKHSIVLFVLALLLTANRQEIIVDDTVIITTSVVFSFTLVWRLLHSPKMIRFYRSILSLPVKSRKLLLDYFIAVFVDLLCTKASYLILAYVLLTNTTIIQVVQMLSFITLGTILAFIVSTLSRKVLLPVLLSIIFSLYILTIVSIQIRILLCWIMFFIIAYIYIGKNPLKLYKNIENKRTGRRKLTRKFFPYLYFYRYIMTKTNLLNLIVLWGFSIFFAYMMVEMGLEDFLAVGLVLLCLNTPLGTVISSQPQNYEKLKALPNTLKFFLLPYSIFVSMTLAVGLLIYIIAVYFLIEEVPSLLLLQAVCVVIQSAFLIVFLESKFPLLNWNTITDLWQHPRKYIVPCVVLIIVMATIVLPKLIYVFLLLLVLQFAFFMRKEQKYVK